MALNQLETPCLLLDQARLQRNIAGMNQRAQALGVRLRPHVKTAKCVEVARMIHAGQPGPITVSTLREAEFFHAGGFDDVVYAVGVVPDRLVRVKALEDQGCRLQLLTDSAAVAAEVAAAGRAMKHEFALLIEIDCDGERAGLRPEDPQVVALARQIEAAAGARFAGFLTHGGGAYHCAGAAQIQAHASQERDAVLKAAAATREAGIEVGTLSVGSTPTATFVDHLQGISETRPGVYVFQDLYQVGLGVCTIDDLALSVLTTVIGHKPEHNRLLIDAGSLALSKDRSTASQSVDCGYGLVCSVQSGEILPGLKVQATNQEHGMVGSSNNQPLDWERFAVGSHLRVLPNHACMTAAAHGNYHLLSADGRVSGTWQRCNGW